MRAFLTIGWGEHGVRVAETWRELNKTHFKNALEPVPIVLVSTSAYGRWLGCTFCNLARKRAHLIRLTMPRDAGFLVADRGMLLHEMLHQALTEEGDSPKHETSPGAADEPVSGFVYQDSLHIFDMPEAGQYLLVIGNQQKVSTRSDRPS